MGAVTTTVHLLRHGEVFNPDGVLYGRLPGFRLSDLGVEQAKLAAQWFTGKDVGLLVASPLQRAQETAVPLAEVTGLPITTDDRLVEAANNLEGRQVAGGKNLFRDPRMWVNYRNPFRPSWGEPYQEIADRMLAAVRAAAAATPHGDAVCVSHQLPIVMAARAALGQHLFHDPRRRRCALASVTSLVLDGDRVTEVHYVEPAAVLPSGHGTGA
ncbi:MAG: histidine phosphatase family protein [Jatrophihabitans sp.]|uniref:histidine phosphatase family protein n=1 Tax=Jatrophihabitans sp. TaxID=1932789 RepID=UPI003F7F88FB